jgi:hypothetical protein
MRSLTLAGRLLAGTLLAGVLTCFSAAAFAHQCDVELQGDLKFENKVLTVTLDNNTQMKIDEYQTLYVNGELYPVNAEQQKSVENYYNGISQVAPQVADIAIDAVALANTALSEVFTELLGADSRALENLSEKLQELDQQVHYNFYAQDGSLRIHSKSFKNGDFFGQEWEQNFEQAIEQVVTESIGTLMVAIGSEILFSGGDMDAFETKMERFGQRLEKTMEFQAEALEEQADDLCTSLASVDSAEAQLQKQIKQLSGLDVLQIKSARYSM